ncbi:LysR substrate-binding domain-containing protein [Spartinivicinus poritis]|uniref:LysR substrate-binding domain-containing protein n=1 Tax=Spartinivicinus poritis TaxID=2994640 RepID=A0ABT5UFM1_9GAMM|nr:LysR substrate-binding domain-containing protein [Spartinivicinus sp. A2-2]MDE1464263.1 LysR substrate-binding domain-containing protein [Spartinivicinus sp. A2-2]
MSDPLQHLGAMRAFAKAAQLSSYSKAADELAITQSAVSQQVRTLEQALGVRLFTRVGRTMQLTEAGENLFQYVDQGLGLIREGINRVQQEELAGELKVTLSPAFASHWLMPKLWLFAEAYPEIRIHMIPTLDLLDLKHDEADVAIRYGKGNYSGLVNEFLAASEGIVVASPNVAKNINKPEDLFNYLLIESTPLFSEGWKSWFDKVDITADYSKLQIIQVKGVGLAIHTVLEGRGIALMSNLVAKQLIKQQALVQLFNDTVEYAGVWLLYDESSPRYRRVQKFTNWLKQEIKSDNGKPGSKFK